MRAKGGCFRRWAIAAYGNTIASDTVKRLCISRSWRNSRSIAGTCAANPKQYATKSLAWFFHARAELTARSHSARYSHVPTRTTA